MAEVDSASPGFLIVTGSSTGGWERIVSTLNKLRFNDLGDIFTHWQDELNRACSAKTAAEIRSLLDNDTSLTRKIAETTSHPELTPCFGAGPESVEVLHAWALAIPQARFLLCFNRPEIAMARALEAGDDPQATWDDWRCINKQLVQFQRQHRRRAALIDADAACRAPATLLSLLRDQGFSAHLPTSEDVSAVDYATPNPLARLAARQFLQDKPQTLDLELQLEASAVPFDVPPDKATQEVSRLVDTYLALQRSANDHAIQVETRRDLERDNELLQLQLAQALEELEAVFSKHQAYLKANSGEQTDRQIVRESAPRSGMRTPTTLLDTDSAILDIESSELEKEAGVHRQHQTRGRDWLTRPWRLLAKKESASDASKKHRHLKRDAQLVAESGLFDRAWYLTRYPDVAQSGADPVKHYLRFGADEGRNPSPTFDTRFYLATHSDVAESGLNPLVHFIRFGRAQGRMTRSH